MPDDADGGIELQHMCSDIETNDDGYDLPLSVLLQKHKSSTTKRPNKITVGDVLLYHVTVFKK